MPVIEVVGVSYDTDAQTYDDGSGPKPFTAEMQMMIDARIDPALIQSEADAQLELQMQADNARQLMFAATDALIAWSANSSPTKYSLATLGPLKMQVQAAMFAYRDVPNEFKTDAGKVQYDYLNGRSVEVAFEIAAAALQAVGQLQTTLATKGLLP